MNQKPASLDEVVKLAKELSPRDRVRLIGLLTPVIERDLMAAPSHPRKSLLGLCSDLGPAPSADEIDEIRRHEWANFPREDV